MWIWARKNSACLKSVAFGSRSCNDNEHNFYLFMGEGAFGCWAISQNRKYLWGCHFYWLCDCSEIKEILGYNGSIPMICRWVQELLGYQFSVIHRHKRVMVDVDALTRHFGSLIVTHCNISSLLHKRNRRFRPLAYERSTFIFNSTSRLTPPNNIYPTSPILTSTFLTSNLMLIRQRGIR